MARAYSHAALETASARRLHDLFMLHEGLHPRLRQGRRAGADLVLGKDHTFRPGAWADGPRGPGGTLRFIDEGRATHWFGTSGRSAEAAGLLPTFAVALIAVRYPGDECGSGQLCSRVFESVSRCRGALWQRRFRRPLCRPCSDFRRANETQDYWPMGESRIAQGRPCRRCGGRGQTRSAGLFLAHRALRRNGRLHNYHWGLGAESVAMLNL